MRFGHYTVFDTPEENKHTQVYVEYDVPNKDNLDGATGTMILSDGSSESSGGGDSRFSTCEVEIFFTKDGQPLTFDTADMVLYNGYSASHIPAVDVPTDTYYQCFPKLDHDHTIITPLLFEGVAYLSDPHAHSGNTSYMANWDTDPVCTGDISIGSFEDSPAVIIRGNGTITIEMMAD